MHKVKSLFPTLMLVVTPFISGMTELRLTSWTREPEKLWFLSGTQLWECCSCPWVARRKHTKISTDATTILPRRLHPDTISVDAGLQRFRSEERRVGKE